MAFHPCKYSDKLINELESLNKKSKEPVNIKLVKKAICYAIEYHGNQLRNSGDPYYSHPLEVAYLFAKYVAENTPQYYTTNLIIVAILHDTIEDTKLTKNDIAENFNQYVADKVEDLTRIKFDKKITAGESVISLFLEHKKDALHIKLFDRLHNMRTIKFMPNNKKEKIVIETLNIFIILARYLEISCAEEELCQLCELSGVNLLNNEVIRIAQYFSL